MIYLAHKTSDGKEQTVWQHLNGVSKLAEEFSIPLLRPFAKVAGEMHDIGKYAMRFQKRLNGDNVKYEHAVCGAIEYLKSADKNDVFAPLIEYCIAGHHTGLPDGAKGADTKEDPTLSGRLLREENYKGDCDYRIYKDELAVQPLNNHDWGYAFAELCSIKDPCKLIELYAFFTKYVFSCLTDADFIDTEAFCNPEAKRGLTGDFNAALEILINKLSSFKADTDVRAARARLQQQAVENSNNDENIYILNMPTGSGKTLCSLEIALKKAVGSNKKRIIYVIPYTSIIEQTASEFQNMFGEVLPVLQHHSNYNYEQECEDKSTADKLKRSCENWDAPLIVTTSVQFFQSFYHYKGSGLRKLHNLADSVIVFDEIHLIPTELIQPCLKAVGHITKYLNSQAVFLSATMPDYSELFENYLPDVRVRNLLEDKSDFKVFKKCNYKNLGKIDYESVVSKAEEYQSSLIIVNSRKAARNVYELVSGKKYHLSTFMTPAHRTKIISEIHNCLEKGEKITVVSTSLVEAGVDFDFETVFRQLAGLDNILQSGGRCNREGKRKSGDVYIFETDDKINDDLKARTNITRDILSNYHDILSEEAVEDYYSRIFSFNKNDIDSNSIAKFNISTKKFEDHIVNQKPMTIPFKSYAESFEYIKADTIGIVIDNGKINECHDLIDRLKSGDNSIKRALQKYTVSVYLYEFENILKTGIIDDFGTGVYVLTNTDYYKDDTGLIVESQGDCYFG